MSETGGRAVTTTTTTNWVVVQASARGSSHERTGAPNQDAARVAALTGAVAVAVADGHGGQRYVRSAAGAAAAAHTAVETAAGWTAEIAGRSLADIERLARERFVPDLVSAWRVSILADHAAHPFTDEEQRIAGGGLDRDPLVAYGATLLLAVATPERLLVCQIGDGDVIVVDAEGEVHEPIAGDERLVGGATTSLCLPTAADDFRVSALHAEGLELVALSTDGYGNSFADSAWRVGVGADLRALLHGSGVESVEEQLPVWAAESARVGGDDVTVALLWRPVGSDSKPRPPATRPAAAGAGSRSPAGRRPTNAVEASALLTSPPQSPPTPTPSSPAGRSGILPRPSIRRRAALGPLLGLLVGATLGAGTTAAIRSRPQEVAVGPTPSPSVPVPSATSPSSTSPSSTSPMRSPTAVPVPLQSATTVPVGFLVGPGGEIVVFRSTPGRAGPRVYSPSSDAAVQASATVNGTVWAIRRNGLSKSDGIGNDSSVKLVSPTGRFLTPVAVTLLNDRLWVLCSQDRIIVVDPTTGRAVPNSYELVSR